jgi:hypothetical protein
VAKTLQEWEAFLDPYFDNIKFLGEIPITLDDVHQIGAALRKVYEEEGLGILQYTILVQNQKTFITFLAKLSAYNEDVDFWGHVRELVGYKNVHAPDFHWGKYFIGMVKGFGLATFDESQFGNKYLTYIRLHGGIPAHSLPDFFEYILDPYITEPEYISLSPKEFIPLILQSSYVQYYVDKPVKNFLEKTSYYAERFVEECRQLAIDYQTDPDIVQISKYDLPRYVIQAYRQYKESAGRNSSGSNQRRFKKPSLHFNPHQGGDFFFNLPAQEILEDEAQTHQFTWKFFETINSEQHYLFELPTRVRRIGHDLEAHCRSQTEVQLHLANYEVGFYKVSKEDPTKAEAFKKWRFNLTQEESPLITIDTETGRYLGESDTLPAKVLWLIYPERYSLSVVGGEPGVAYPPLVGPLSNMKFEEWNLTNANQVVLLPETEGKRIPYLVAKGREEPILEGENQCFQNNDPDSTPLFIGQPPKLLLPRSKYRSIEKDRSQWEIRLQSKWAADPEINSMFSLSDWPNHDDIEVRENWIAVKLNSLIGNESFGTYQLQIHGEYGADVFLSFRIIPKLKINDLREYYLPGDPSYENIQFSVEIPENFTINLLDPTIKNQVKLTERENGTFTIDTLKNIETVELSIIKKNATEKKSDIRLPVFIPVVRLKWKALLDLQSQTEDWCTEPITISVDELFQAQESLALIRLPILRSLPVRFRIDLADFSSGNTLQEGKHVIDVGAVQTIWRYNLAQFEDTINEKCSSSSLGFSLKIFDEHYIQIASVAILFLRRYLELDSFSMEALDPGIRITWESKNRLENRRIRIWSVWQPWQQPIELKIPDSCENLFEDEKVGLPNSCYKIQFFTQPPWENQEPPFFPPEKGFVTLTSSVEERLNELAMLQSGSPDKEFKASFERACIFNSIRDEKRFEAELRTCWRLISQQIEQINIRHALTLYQWLGDKDTSTQKAMRFFLIKPSLFNNVLTKYGNEGWAWHELVDIFLKASTKTISTQIALLILKYETNPLARLHAFGVLINSGHPETARLIINEITSGQLSESDAISLIKRSPDINFENLYEMQKELPDLSAIVEQWAKDEGWVVKIGDWVHSPVGWGQIKKIINSATGEEIDRFIYKVEKPTLIVAVRPTLTDFEIRIDIGNEEIKFDRANLYQCRKPDCLGFIATNQEDLKHHNDRSHNGRNQQFCIIRTIPSPK